MERRRGDGQSAFWRYVPCVPEKGDTAIILLVAEDHFNLHVQQKSP